MAVVVYCPNLCCPAVLRAPSRYRGRVVSCAECGTRFRLPHAPAADEPSAAELAEPYEPVVEVVLDALTPAEMVHADTASPSRRATVDFPMSRQSGLSPR